MTYIAPMRRAVLWLCSLGKAWDVASLVNAANVEERRAAAYVTILARQKALAYDDDLLRPGARFLHYAGAKVATRPGGNANAYRESARLRAAVYMEDVDARRIVGHRLRESRLAAQMTLQEVASDSGISFQHLAKVERGLEGISPDALFRVDFAIAKGLALVNEAIEQALKEDDEDV